jgi:predicted DCC family thiol-disulfide oxidoreductase YuxK
MRPGSLQRDLARRSNMSEDFPLTVFYDASCPVCALEMDTLVRRDPCHRLQLIDMSAPAFDAAIYGLERADLDAALHAVRPDGSVVRGMAALRLAYAAGGLGWLLQATRWQLLTGAADGAYRLFARHRHAISRVLAPAIRAARARPARRFRGRP